MRDVIRHIIVASRPRQWLKNLALFIPLVMYGRVFSFDRALEVGLGAVAFSFLSSSNYIVNDLLDIASDRLHPFKKHRPIANEDLTYNQALGSALFFGIVGFGIAFILGGQFLLFAFLFVFLHYLSNFHFRKVAVMDVLIIASGYLLRILAGEAISDVRMSVWLFLTVLSASLLLAIGKRRNELSVTQQLSGKLAREKEESFHYSEKILDSYVAVFASATFLAYTYFTFLSTISENGLFFRGYSDYLITVLTRKWMMITVPFVLYGIMRYLQLVYSGKEILVKVITNDKQLIITAILWIITVFLVVYGIGG